MTGYTVHTGSNENFSSGWDSVFDKGTKGKKKSSGKAAAKPAKKTASKKTSAKKSKPRKK